MDKLCAMADHVPRITALLPVSDKRLSTVHGSSVTCERSQNTSEVSWGRNCVIMKILHTAWELDHNTPRDIMIIITRLEFAPRKVREALNHA